MSAAPRARDDETAARVVMAWPSAAAATDQPRDSEPVGEVASSGRRPTELLDVVRHLTVLQIDPTAAIAPTADLVAWSRLGPSYSPAELLTALEDRMLLEHRAMIRPSEDLALYRADMADWPGRGELRDWQEYRRDWVQANDACRRDILDRLGSSGPLPSRDLPDTCKVPWGSTVDQQSQRHAAARVHGGARGGRDRWTEGT